MKPVIILGAGGHARVVRDMLETLGAATLGHIGPVQFAPGTYDQAAPYLGTDEVLLSRDPNAIALANGIGSTAPGGIRATVFEQYLKAGFTFPSLAHPRAIVSSRVTLHEGVQVMAGAIIQSGAVIGANTLINTGAIVDHDCRIGNHVHIAPGVTLSGDITIGNDVHLGTGTCVRNGVTIVDGCLIGVGAVVVGDIEEPGVYHGVPARRI